jgi:prepilin peptidase CpaA
MEGLPAGLGTFSGLVLLLCLTACAASDLYCRKIFNCVTYSALLWAMVVNATASCLDVAGYASDLSWLGAIGLKQSLGGAALCFLAVLLAYCLARGGAGDVKLATAVGALIGAEQGVLAVALSYIIAGAAAAAWTAWARGPRELLGSFGRLFGSMLFPRWVSPPTPADQVLLNQQIPLGGFFAVGTLLVVLDVRFWT